MNKVIDSLDSEFYYLLYFRFTYCYTTLIFCKIHQSHDFGENNIALYIIVTHLHYKVV